MRRILGYNPRTIEGLLEKQYPGLVSSRTMTRNTSGRILHNGKEILIDARGFPIFDDVAAFQTHLPRSVSAIKSRPLHFKEATQALNESILRGEVSASSFSKKQLDAIRSGAEKIPGFTWHHHQEIGRIMLIPTDIHQAVGHQGGFKYWY